MSFLQKLEKILEDRKSQNPSDSYTAKLIQDGKDRILRKIGEEAAELIIAAKNHPSLKESRSELVCEASDLIYHFLVLLVHENIPFQEVLDELEKRNKP